MIRNLALTTLAVAAANGAAFNTADSFKNSADLQKDVARLQQLTTGTPITTLCVDANGAKLAGAALTQCPIDLAKELVALQSKLTDAFFDAFVQQFNPNGTPFNRAKIDFFDNKGECEAFVAKFTTLAAADAAALKAQCAGNIVVAADAVHEKVRALHRTEQATVNGNVVKSLADLDQAQLPVFDKFNGAQVAAFNDVANDVTRLKQNIAGFQLAQIASAVAELGKGNYEDYKNEVVLKANVDKEVAQLLVQAKVELSKDARLVDAAKRLNALQQQETGLLVKGAFDLAAKRKEVVDAPVAVVVRVSNIAAADVTATTDALKAALGPEIFFGKVVDDAKNAGKKQVDVAIGQDAGEVRSQDVEFALTCVKQQLKCEILEDVHKETFDLVQVAAATTAPVVVNNGGNNGGNGGYGNEAPAAPAHHNTGAADEASGSSVFLAVGAVLASLALFL